MFIMTSRVKDLTSIFVYGTLKRNEPNHHLRIKGNNGILSGNTSQYPVIPHKIRFYPTYLVTNPPKIVTTPLSLYNANTFKKKVYEY